LEAVAVNDSFGESGTPDQLMTKYGLDTVNIVAAVKKVLKRKQETVTL
jgi:transketolase